MQILRDYALSFVGTPYRWGGDDPMAGFDCSGLVQEIIASAGIDPAGDQSAQTLFDHFSNNGKMNTWGCGALAFFGKDLKSICHIGFCVDQYRMIEAGSGSSKTVTLQDAINKNAYVRMRLIKARKDFITVVMPYYNTIGVI